MNPIVNATANARGAMMAGLRQGYLVPASSRANIKRTEKASSSDMPSISSRAQIDSRNLERTICFIESWEDSSDIGRKTASVMKATAPPGMLGGSECQRHSSSTTRKETQGRERSYFSRKTQRQEEWVLMTPPRTGPSTLAMRKTVATMAMYLPYLRTGTKVGARTRTME